MFDFFEILVQVLLSMALIYGMAIAFRNWRTTVPRGAESDAEFANHRYVELLRNAALAIGAHAPSYQSEASAVCTPAVAPALALHWFAARERRRYRGRFPHGVERRQYN